jgi:hypothetical protein
MTTITTRVVKTRDAATSILRKLGLKPNMYGLFMKKLDDGRFEVDLPKVYEQGYGVNGAIKAEKPTKSEVVGAVKAIDKMAQKMAASVKKAKAKEPKAKQEPKPRRVSVSSVAEELLLAGKTNEEVFAVLKEKFKLDDSKKNYPSWYRCRLKRQKKLAEEKS